MLVKWSLLWQPRPESVTDSSGLKCEYCIFVASAQGWSDLWSDLFSPPLTRGTAASSETVCVTLVDRVFLRPSIHCLCGGFIITVHYISCLILDFRDSKDSYVFLIWCWWITCTLWYNIKNNTVRVDQKVSFTHPCIISTAVLFLPWGTKREGLSLSALRKFCKTVDTYIFPNFL